MQNTQVWKVIYPTQIHLLQIDFVLKQSLGSCWHANEIFSWRKPSLPFFPHRLCRLVGINTKQIDF